ncbi:MAG TPA: hypothetical protein GXZ31_05350 [Thermoanaerobacterales bacterium]|nr:hypothetical protein [Thermoanaerobacterales bacterium]
MRIGWYLIGVLFIFLCGYGLGRRIGKKEGYSEGTAYAPIQLKQSYFENGECPVCCFKIDNDINDNV